MQEQTDVIYITAVMCIHWRAFEFGCWVLPNHTIRIIRIYPNLIICLNQVELDFFLAWKLSIYIEFNQGYSREPATINLDVSA